VDLASPAVIASCGSWRPVTLPVRPFVIQSASATCVPAREGALRELRAAQAAGVKGVVLTSSFAAIDYGQKPQEAPFDWDF
jgi:hypothetical protein